MKQWKIIVPAVLVVLALSAYFFLPSITVDVILQLFGKKPDVGSIDIDRPHDFQLEVFAKNLEKPRVIEFDPRKRILVSELGANRVSVLEPDAQGALVRRTLIENLRSPHGLAFYENPKTKTTYLYIAETHQVNRYVYDVEQGTLDSSTSENIATLPADGRHSTRTIAFGPNFRTKPIVGGYIEAETQLPKKLYVSVGSSCDVCVEETWKRAAMLEADAEGTFLAEFAGGLRNSVFFTFHPVTRELWATDMGRDNLGDNLPPDEINIVRVAGTEHKFGARRYGWPFCYGNKVTDTAFKPNPYTRIDVPSDCSQTEPAHIEIPAHSAPLGLAFITSDEWPAEWKNNLLVAYHGSWNRSTKAGYKIVRYAFDEQGKVTATEDFLNWLDDGRVSGRPVDLKFDDKGILYISDDSTGSIYKVTPQ